MKTEELTDSQMCHLLVTNGNLPPHSVVDDVFPSMISWKLLQSRCENGLVDGRTTNIGHHGFWPNNHWMVFNGFLWQLTIALLVKAH